MDTLFLLCLEYLLRYVYTNFSKSMFCVIHLLLIHRYTFQIALEFTGLGFVTLRLELQVHFQQSQMVI